VPADPGVLSGRINKKAILSINEEKTMLWTIVVIMIILWVLGLVSSYTMGGLIHILLVVAVIALLVQIIQGRRIL
jgi:Family of unknown function (DUF5670)